MTPEPRVFVVDIREAIAKSIRPDQEDDGESRTTLAERAGCSVRTIDRIISLERTYLELDLADRILIAAGEHLSSCRLLLADGTIECPYE